MGMDKQINYPNELTSEACVIHKDEYYFGLFSIDKNVNNTQNGLYKIDLVSKKWTKLVEIYDDMHIFGLTIAKIDDDDYVIGCIPTHYSLLMYNINKKTHNFIPLVQSPNDITTDYNNKSLVYICTNPSAETGSIPLFNQYANKSANIDFRLK